MIQLNSEPHADVNLNPLSGKGVAEPKARTGYAFLNRLKRIKHIEIYAAIAIIVIMVAIYISTFTKSSTGGSDDPYTAQIRANEDSYAREMEQLLAKTLGQIQGAGRVSAMVTVASSATLEIAYNYDEKTITQTGAGGNSTTTTTIVKTPVIINGKNGPQPIILFEIKPKLKGVVIVASGANDVSVRLALLRAVQALVADPTVNIEILPGK